MIAVFLANSIVIALTVIIHYEFLFKLMSLMRRSKISHRLKIVLGVLGSLIAHAVEIWLFALAYYFMSSLDGWGGLRGDFDGSLFDCAYFSFTTYTTLGFGDIQPYGDLRYLTGLESLTGLVLITWTASFLYLEMQRYWNTE